MTGINEEPINFKDFKSACDYAEKFIFKGQPRYVVESMVHFQINHKSILDKTISGVPLNEEEQIIFDAGKEFKKNNYSDGTTIEKCGEVLCSEDAPQELIDELFTHDVSSVDVERISLDDVPKNYNQEKVLEIMNDEFIKEQD